MVMAKAPWPGRVKTRLCPPCTPAGAARIATAALMDTLDAVSRCGADRRILALEGEPGPWLPAGFELIPQRGMAFDERLANAWADAAGPGVQIGMDTPQVTPALLDHALDTLDGAGVDAVLGSAHDGGWWAVGLKRSDRRAFLGVPMSRADTGEHQRRRLDVLGLRVAELPRLRDVDHIDDARRVAAMAPGTRFSRALARHS